MSTITEKDGRSRANVTVVLGFGREGKRRGEAW